MESNWRWNIYKFGIWPLPITLCARIRSGLFAGLYISDWVVGGGVWLLSVNAGTQLATLGFIDNEYDVTKGFPYLADVDPDH